MSRDQFALGLPTAETFFEVLEKEEIARAERPRKPYGVVRLHAPIETRRDLFEICGTLSAALRQGDRVMPIGGGEVAILLADADEAEVASVTERLREELQLEGIAPPRIGAACVKEPGWRAWHEAWTLAGVLLVADGKERAAA